MKERKIGTNSTTSRINQTKMNFRLYEHGTLTLRKREELQRHEREAMSLSNVKKVNKDCDNK